MKLHQGPVFINFMVNSTDSSLQDEFRKGRPKSVVVLETVNAVRQLILQDRHVTYREIEITLGISETYSIHSILHEHLTVKKNLFALDRTQFVNCSKKSIIQSDKSASTIGSNACNSVYILIGNISKNNKAIFDD